MCEFFLVRNASGFNNLSVPLYDLTDKSFDPAEDFMNASLIRKHMPGIEVPTTVPTLATFYITKYMQHGVVNIDFNLQWVGVLCKDPDAK